MDAMGTPASASRPAIATKLFTVDELVKVIQSGFRDAPKITRALAAA